MTIDVEMIMMWLSYLLFGVGVLAFFVAAVVEVIKDMPWLIKMPTSLVALVTSMILCPIAVVILCQYFKIVITWYYVFASFIAAFVVYLVATSGWERVAEIWNRSKYRERKYK